MLLPRLAIFSTPALSYIYSCIFLKPYPLPEGTDAASRSSLTSFRPLLRSGDYSQIHLYIAPNHRVPGPWHRRRRIRLWYRRWLCECQRLCPSACNARLHPPEYWDMMPGLYIPSVYRANPLTKGAHLSLCDHIHDAAFSKETRGQTGNCARS